MRLALCALLVLAALAVGGMALIRTTLLENAYETGTALSRHFAAEEQANLAVYETLLSFGTASVDCLAAGGAEREEVETWLGLYFARLTTALGGGAVDPYLVWQGEILAANPWEGDSTYDAESADWYRQAQAAGGQVVFTDVYIDAVYDRPVITVAQQCLDGEGVMAFDVLPEDFRLDMEQMDARDSFFLCDGRGALIYGRTALELPREELEAYLGFLVSEIAAGRLDAPTESIRDLDGNRRGVYYTAMENGWYAILTVPYSSILGSLNRFIAGFGLVLAVAVGILTVFTWREVRLNEGIRRAQETVQVLGNTYYALYRVDYERETYEMIKGSDYVRRRIPATGAYDLLIRTAGEVIEAGAFREFAESFSCEKIRGLVHQRVRDFGGEFLRRFGEEYRWVSVRVLFDEGLAPQEVVLSFREVDAEKQRQLRERQLLEDALELARQNEASKQTFFSSMSHDMRTPLNAIIGMSQLAAGHVEEPAAVAGYLEKIGASSRYLLGLINDILDMSRMEQGKMLLDNRTFDLAACVEECLAPLRLQAEAEGKTLTDRVELENGSLLGDAFRIQQILNNLLSNALKFTPAGGRISLEVQQLDRGDYAKYRFVVSDTGIGMEPAFLERLFEPYAREMRFSAKEAAGTGLGMSITKSLVTLMHGEIQVESQPGKGSVFTVVLPLAAAERQGPSAEAEAFSLEGLRILLAEDNPLNMEIAAEVLEAQGVRVTQAWNGAEALETFRESDPFFFDAILMDMQMPELDGCEAARRIRALDRPDAARVPIVAVTANAFAEDLAATTAAGMDAHVSKPIDFGELGRTLARLVRRSGEG